jgi:hypothetical protein
MFGWSVRPVRLVGPGLNYLQVMARLLTLINNNISINQLIKGIE